MKIDDLLEELQDARALVGNAEIKLGIKGHGSAWLRHDVNGIYIGVNGEEDESTVGIIHDEVWLLEGAQDPERPYGVPDLEPLDNVV